MKTISFDIECLKCGKNLHCPQTAAGKKVKCPKCKTIFVADPLRGNGASPIPVVVEKSKQPVVESNVFEFKKQEPLPPSSEKKTKPVQIQDLPTAIAPPLQTETEAKPVSSTKPVYNYNLRYCKACSGVVSSQAFNCVHCGHQLRKPQRGPIGFLIKWVFILFNLLMIYWIYAAFSASSRHIVEAESDAERTGAVLGTTIGLGMVLGFWMMGAVILGILVLLTRPRTA